MWTPSCLLNGPKPRWGETCSRFLHQSLKCLQSLCPWEVGRVILHHSLHSYIHGIQGVRHDGAPPRLRIVTTTTHHHTLRQHSCLRQSIWLVLDKPPPRHPVECKRHSLLRGYREVAWDTTIEGSVGYVYHVCGHHVVPKTVPNHGGGRQAVGSSTTLPGSGPRGGCNEGA